LNLSQDKSGTMVHVAVALRKTALETIATFESAGVELDLLTTEAAAYRAFLNRIVTADNQVQPVMIARIGHTRTVIYVHQRGMPVMARELSWGGRELTLTLAQRFGVPLDQAEQMKLDHGFVIPPSQRGEATPEQIEFSDALLAPVQKLVWNLRQAKITAKNITNENITQVYVTGGTSILPGLSQVIEETVQAPVSPLQALSSIATTSGVTYSEAADATFLNAAAVAMCYVGPDKSALINFRKGPLGKKGKGGEFQVESLKGPAMGFGAVMLCLLISLIVQSSSYKAQLANKNKELERAVKQFFPMVGESTVRTYLASLSELKKRVTTQINKQREMAKLMAPNPRDPLDVIRKLSTAIPKDVVVDLINTQVGAAPGTQYEKATTGDASLTFLVASPQMIDRLQGLLTPLIGGIRKSGVEEVPAKDDIPKRYKVTFSGKLTEAAYGE
jgi:cell division ATPase FtsA